MYDDDARFFAEMEEEDSFLEDEEDSPLWAIGRDDPQPQDDPPPEKPPVSVEGNPVLMESVMSDRQFIPEYSSEIQEDFQSPSIIMHSLEGYLTATYPEFTTWSWCEKCKLEGPYKGNRVYPSLVRLETTPYIGQPVNLLVLGEGPGAEENQAGFGFVGLSGSLLMRYFYQIWEATLPVMMFGNSVICRPKDNVTPTITQVKRCGGNFWPTLLADRNLIADNCMIIASGAISYKMLYAIADGTPTPSNILSAHGMPTQLSFRNPNNLEDVRTFTVLPMVHPAYVLRGRSPEKFKIIQDDFINAYNAWCDIQEMGQVNVPAFLKQPSNNTVDLDTDLLGDLYTDTLTDNEVEIIMAMIESDYKNEKGQKIVSYDVETTALETQLPTTVITLAGIGTINKHTFQFEGEAIPSISKIFRKLKEKGYYIVGHNIWYDLIMSWKAGIFSCVDELPEIRDTRVMHKLIDENSTDNKLKWLCQKYFGIKDWSMELNSMMDSEGKVQWSKLTDENKITLRKYHKGDLYWTVRLCYLFIDMISDPAVSQYWQIDYVDFKSTLQKELLQTSINGFMINRQTLDQEREEYQTKQDTILEWFKQPLYYRVIASLKLLDKPLKEAVQKTLCNFAIGDTYNEKKDTFNPNSTQHVAALLATVLSSDDLMRQKIIKGLGRKGKTAKGKLSLNESNLEKICESLVNATSLLGGSNPHKYSHLVEGIKKVLEFRGLKKIISTYLEGMEKYMWPDGSVRSQWNVDGAATGRLSCIAEGTLISCESGNKPIEDIQAGDIVYCYDESNKMVKRPVVELIDQGMRQCIELVWELSYPNDSRYRRGVLVCTPDHNLRAVSYNHPFYTWIPAEMTNNTSVILDGMDGAYYHIAQIAPVGIKHVYDLTIEEHHNFIAGGLSVHNCARPNGQNLPRGDTAKGIKSMFVPRYDGYIFMQFDLSQAELRGLGSFSHDPNLKQAYDQGLDLHTYTAANMWHGGDIEKVSKHERSVAKTINFSTIYGANAPTVAGTAGITVPEAEEAMKKWFEFYSFVQPFMEHQGELVGTQGFVTGLWGLKRNLPMSMSYESDGADLKRMGQNCVDVETEILTVHGWCKYYDLHEGDQILSFNMSTHHLERDIVKRVNVYTHRQYECVEFRHPSLSAVTTLNHRWPVYTPRDSNPYHFVTTQDMSTKGYDRILRCATGLEAGISMDVPESPIQVEEAHYRLLGWLLTDGSMKGTKNLISQSITANQQKVERIERILINTGLSYTKKIKNNNICGGSYQVAYFYIHKCPFMDWVRQLVTGEYALRPEFIFTLSMNQARWIIEEMILGDGTVGHSKVSICCGNKAKADSLQLLACVAGFGSSSACRVDMVGRKAYGRVGNSTGYVETKKPYYTVALLNRDKAHIYTHHRHPKVVDTVWCPTTGNGTWVARRNGKVYITGNSPIQNFASDFNCFLMMIVMGYVRDYNLRKEIRMVNTVHDSIVFEVKGGYESTLASFYYSAMDQMNKYCASLIGEEYYINMRGDLEIGLTYGDLHEANVNPETFEVTLIEE